MCQQYEKLAKSDLVERAVELVVQFMLEKGYEKASVEARQSQKAGSLRTVCTYVCIVCMYGCNVK